MATDKLPDSPFSSPGTLQSHGTSPRAGHAADLSAEASAIIDREEDLAAITSLLLEDEVRLLTLTGPAGVGKTRLVREVGRTVAPHFPQGVVFVDLAAVRDPALVLTTLGVHIGVLDIGAQPLMERLQTFLSDRKMLIILDNLEQVLPADVGLDALLVAVPNITVLATSREPLHLLWEQLYHVSPLALPDPEHLPALEEFLQIPSVALFLQRARRINPNFRLTETNARAIAELVVHLDGLPLAIKLAASRTQLLSPQMLLERLSQRLSLLRWEIQDLPERQHTLRAALAWSYDLLSPMEQVVFRRLGVFVGGFTLEAAEAISEGAEQHTADGLEALGSLVDKSLVQREEDAQGDYGFRLLESVREFALERLREAGELDAAQRSHAFYYLALAEQAEPQLTGPQQRAWFLRLEKTHDNLRAALAWLLDHDEAEAGLRLAVALGHFWEIRGYLAEGQRWLQAALACAPAAPASLRTRALTWLGAILVMSVDLADVRAIDPVARAVDVLSEGMALARTSDDRISAARALTFLGILSMQTGEWERGREFLHEALATWQEARDDRGIVQVLVSLGIIAFLQGHDEESMQRMDEILDRYQHVGDDWARGVALFISLSLMAAHGEKTRAVALANELLGLSVQSQSGRILFLAAAVSAWLMREHGEPEHLAQLVGAAEAMDQAAGLVAGVLERTSLTSTRDDLRSRMEQQDLEAALYAGRTFGFAQVAALIEQVLGESRQEAPHQEPAGGREHTGLLSQREQEVLQLVAEGLSNKQIAKELFIAESTVRYHLTSIFNKLGVDTRTHALAVAAQRGLILLGPAP